MNPDMSRSDSKKLIEPLQWCRYIVYTGYAVSGLIILAHVIWFFAARNILAWPPEIYVRDYILLPTVGLPALCFLVHCLIGRDRIPLSLKEFLSLTLFILFSF